MVTRRSSAGRRTQRRQTTWARAFQTNLAVPATGTTAVDDLLVGTGSIETFLAANSLPGATVGRIRGYITAVPGAVAAAHQCRVGFRVIRSSTTGLAAEGPFTSPYLNWMGWEPFGYQPSAVGPANADLQYQIPAISRYIDVQSMRKLSELDESLFLVAESVDATTWQLTYDLSILLLLA